MDSEQPKKGKGLLGDAVLQVLEMLEMTFQDSIKLTSVSTKHPSDKSYVETESSFVIGPCGFLCDFNAMARKMGSI